MLLFFYFVDANRADKIASNPEMISPVWLFFHLWAAFEEPYGQFTFQYPNHLRNRHLRRNRHDNMNVINLNTHFLNLTFFPFTQHLYILFYQLFDFLCQDPKPVFGYPNKMILILLNNMRQLLVLTHATNIGMADRTLPPPKEVGF